MKESCAIATSIGSSSSLSNAAALFPRDPFGKPLIGSDLSSVYTYGLLIRKTEELLLDLFSKGLLSGTTHTCLGQELCQMSVVRALSNSHDVVLSNHRNHGHFLTYSGDFKGLVSEIMGRRDGVCGGIGGSQHLAYRHFHSNGVQGGMTAIGAGHGLAIRKRGTDAIVVSIIGDGTLGQGLLYESMNLSSVWQVPVLFVVENNGIAQTTVTAETTGGTILGRGEAFGLRTWRYDDSDPNFLSLTEAVVEEVRRTKRPGMLVIDTMRLGPHSKGDDLRPQAEMEAIRARDPLTRIASQLDPAERRRIYTAVEEYIRVVHDEAYASPPAAYKQIPQHIFTSHGAPPIALAAPAGEKQNVRASLNAALRQLLTESPEVMVLGEDLHDPYGGAFKVTAGLSTDFPGRVISTPISEAGVVGAAIGLALDGFLPVVEIMFADFVTLAMDQIFNHAVKFPGMFPGTTVPLVIRTPGGGRRGYGPTHSQSPETLLTGIPGLTLLFPGNRHDPGALLQLAVLHWPYPVVFLEHKLLYGKTVDAGEYAVVDGSGIFPTLAAGSPSPDVTIVCYGGSVELAESAAAKLTTEELETEIVIPSMISPMPPELVAHLKNRERIVVVEEAHYAYGFAAELGAALLEAGFRGTYLRVGPPPIPIPAARSLESQVLPGEDAVVNGITASILAEIVAGPRV